MQDAAEATQDAVAVDTGEGRRTGTPAGCRGVPDAVLPAWRVFGTGAARGRLRIPRGKRRRLESFRDPKHRPAQGEQPPHVRLFGTSAANARETR